MKSRTLASLSCSLVLATLAACGGSGTPVSAGAPAPAPQAMASAPQLPVASVCNDPACMAPAGGLADEFRLAAMERAAIADQDSQPAYPNVPSDAVTVAEARAPVAYGTAARPAAR